MRTTPDNAKAGATPSLPVPAPIPAPSAPAIAADVPMASVPMATEVPSEMVTAASAATVEGKESKKEFKSDSKMGKAAAYVFNRLVGARESLAPMNGATPAPVKDRDDVEVCRSFDVICLDIRCTRYVGARVTRVPPHCVGSGI